MVEWGHRCHPSEVSSRASCHSERSEGSCRAEFDPFPSKRLPAKGGKVQGSAGCNGMMASYELNGASLKFAPIMSTKMACPAMDTEQAFLKALESTSRYEINGSSLTLYGPDGALARLEPGTSGAD